MSYQGPRSIGSVEPTTALLVRMPPFYELLSVESTPTQGTLSREVGNRPHRMPTIKSCQTPGASLLNALRFEHYSAVMGLPLRVDYMPVHVLGGTFEFRESIFVSFVLKIW